MIKCYTVLESKRKELEPLPNRHSVMKSPMQYINAECEELYFSFSYSRLFRDFSSSDFILQ